MPKQDHQLFSIHLTRSELKEVATFMHLEDMRSTSWDQQEDFYNIESGEQLLIQYVLQSEFNLMVLLTDRYDSKSKIIYSITS